jgi:hypothetical protein
LKRFKGLEKRFISDILRLKGIGLSKTDAKNTKNRDLKVQRVGQLESLNLMS